MTRQRSIASPHSSLYLIRPGRPSPVTQSVRLLLTLPSTLPNSIHKTSFRFALSKRRQLTWQVADLEGAEPALPPPLGRRTDAVTRGTPEM